MSLPTESFAAAITRRTLLLDGAVGTELERRGVPTPPPLWSAAAIASHPDVVSQIHREYAQAGANILVANTFRTNPRALERAGHALDGAASNRQAVELAREAAKGAAQPIWIAASVAPVEDCYSPDLTPDDRALVAEHRRMADWLAAAQPDLIWIETMNSSREAAIAAAEAARVVHAAAGKPPGAFVVSFVVQDSGDLLSGDRLEDAIHAVSAFDPAAIGVNCIPPRGMAPILRRLSRITSLPLIAYGHIGNARPLRGWNFADTAVTPAEYATYAREWLACGAKVGGGCCGTTPALIAALRKLRLFC